MPLSCFISCFSLVFRLHPRISHGLGGRELQLQRQEATPRGHTVQQTKGTCLLREITRCSMVFFYASHSHRHRSSNLAMHHSKLVSSHSGNANDGHSPVSYSPIPPYGSTATVHLRRRRPTWTFQWRPPHRYIKPYVSPSSHRTSPSGSVAVDP